MTANQPKLALSDVEQVLKEDSDIFPAICTQVRPCCYYFSSKASSKAQCLFLLGDFEKSLVVWHKAKKLRGNTPEV